MWHLLVLTGAHIGEVLALTRADLLPDGLLIDESARDGHPSTTKNKKSRTVRYPLRCGASWKSGSLSTIIP